MPSSTFIARASKAGVLMSDARGEKPLSPEQVEELRNLQDRKDKEGHLPKSVAAKLAGYERRYGAMQNPSLSATAQDYILETWLRNEFGYNEEVVTDEMLKGQVCEQDSMALVSELMGGFRMKCKKRKTDAWFTGHCDVLHKEAVEDIKTCWSLKTFVKTTSYPELYYAQGQVYMHLYKKDVFRLFYCLVDTPPEMVTSLQKRLWYKYQCDDNSPEYKFAADCVERNHSIASKLPAQERVRMFEIERNQDYIDELKARVERARTYYNSLTLTGGLGVKTEELIS